MGERFRVIRVPDNTERAHQPLRLAQVRIGGTPYNAGVTIEHLPKSFHRVRINGIAGDDSCLIDLQVDSRFTGFRCPSA